MNLKKLWHFFCSRSLGEQVVAGLVVSLVSVWFFNHTIADGIRSAWNLTISDYHLLVAYLNSTILLRGWAFLGLVIFASCLVVLESNRIRNRLSRDPSSKYTTDAYLAWLWRWRRDFAGKILDLRAFCPREDMEIVWSDGYDAFSATCLSCGRRANDLPGCSESLLKRARLEFERRLRTGEWRQASTRIAEKQREARRTE